MNLNTPPPNKLSDLIDLAIADARKLDRNRYIPMWSTWHAPGDGADQCMICLAGSVIAGRLGCPMDASVEVTTSDMAEPKSTTIESRDWRQALWALDCVREGDWFEAFHELHGRFPETELYETLEAMPEPLYTEFESWERLDTHLGSLAERANELREIGL